MKKIISFLLLICICVPILLCSCAQPRKEPLSEDEVTALRGTYAYLEKSEMLSYRPIIDLKELAEREDGICGFAAVTVTGDWVEITESVLMGKEIGYEDITAMILPVHIDQTFFGRTKFSGSADTHLWFGSSLVVPEPEKFKVGDRLVLPVMFPSEPDAFAKGGIDEYLCTSTDGYYLTDDNAIISTTNQFGYEKYSGWYLDDFGREINKMVK